MSDGCPVRVTSPQAEGHTLVFRVCHCLGCAEGIEMGWAFRTCYHSFPLLPFGNRWTQTLKTNSPTPLSGTLGRHLRSPTLTLALKQSEWKSICSPTENPCLTRVSVSILFHKSSQTFSEDDWHISKFSYAQCRGRIPASCPHPLPQASFIPFTWWGQQPQWFLWE